jgi:hypothetical protein
MKECEIIMTVASFLKMRAHRKVIVRNLGGVVTTRVILTF